MAADKSNRVLRHTRAAVELLSTAGALAPPEVARELGIPRPSAYRLLAALVHAGLADQQPDGRVSLSIAWLTLGDAALRAASQWFTREDVLEDLRERTGLTIFLSVPREDRTVCIRRLHGRSYKILVLHPGGSLPLHLGGVGRVTLAFGPQDADDYLSSAPFEPLTPFSLVTRTALEEDIRATRQTGVCFSDQDVTVGVGALAVPVLLGSRLVAALSVAGRREDLLARESELSPLLIRAAGDIATP